MSNLNRLRELASLLKPSPVAEARVESRADLEKQFKSVEDTIKDLASDISTGGALEKMMKDVGLSSHKDTKGLLTTLNQAMKTIQAAMMEVEGLLFSAMTESRHPGPVFEMAAIGDFSSGWLKTREAKALVAAFKGGEETADLKDGSKFRASRAISSAQLVKGMVVLGSHNSTNQGARIYEFKGVTDTEGGDDAKYDSVKEAMKAAGAKNLKELEAKGGDGEGYRLVVKDLEDGDEGGFFYLFRGRYVQGSGAEPLSFTLVEKVESVKEELSPAQKKALVKDFKEWSGGFGPNDCDAKQISSYIRTSLGSELDPKEAKAHLMDMMTEGLNEAKNHMDENTYQSVASWKRALKAMYGDEIKYTAHEGTIDAFVGKKQVGDWDDTTGTVY